MFACQTLFGASGPTGSKSTARLGTIKYAMRQSWDFALASAAVVLTSEAGRCRNCRIVLGGVAPTPWRSFLAEREVEGKLLVTTNIEGAAAAAVADAKPLKHQEYKLGL